MLQPITQNNEKYRFHSTFPLVAKERHYVGYIPSFSIVKSTLR